jgi:single-stranded-DNA-specific exonuclease
MEKIKNIEKLSKRLKKAVEGKEKIVLHGDSDLDGIASVIILEEVLKEMGLDSCFIYFPDRFKEGHGISFQAIEYLNKKISGNFLLILLDSGITSFDQIEKIEQDGNEVIVIDHHQPLGKLPKASLIVDPKQKGDKYFFKNLANTGLVFKIAEEILSDKLNKNKTKNFLELTALATISDMMERAHDNDFFIKQGLNSLKKTKRKGLILLKDFFQEDISIKEKSQKIISLLNVGEIIEHKAEGYSLLKSENEEEIKTIIKKLFNRNEERHLKINDLIKEIQETISFKDKFIFEYNDRWDESILGAVASRLCQKTKKPVFLLKKYKDYSKGTARAPLGFNVVDIMNNYSDLLKSFGGHPPAAGLSMKNENIENFKKKLTEHFNY